MHAQIPAYFLQDELTIRRDNEDDCIIAQRYTTYPSAISH